MWACDDGDILEGRRGTLLPIGLHDVLVEGQEISNVALYSRCSLSKLAVALSRPWEGIWRPIGQSHVSFCHILGVGIHLCCGTFHTQRVEYPLPQERTPALPRHLLHELVGKSIAPIVVEPPLLKGEHDVKVGAESHSVPPREGRSCKLQIPHLCFPREASPMRQEVHDPGLVLDGLVRMIELLKDT